MVHSKRILTATAITAIAVFLLGYILIALSSTPPPPVLPAPITRIDLPTNVLVPELGNLRRARHLLNKLDAGQPINIYVLGSSITGSGAGCTKPNVHLHARNSTCCGMRCQVNIRNRPQGHNVPGQGWLRRALEWVNTTWPHPDHSLTNLGAPGGLPTYYEGCITAHIPDLDRLDLLVFEGSSYAGMKPELRAIERLLRTITPARAAPTALFIKFPIWRNCFECGVEDNDRVDSKTWLRSEASIAQYGPRCEAELIPAQVQAFFKHYGFPTIDVGAAFMPRVGAPLGDPLHVDLVPGLTVDCSHPNTLESTINTGDAMSIALHHILQQAARLEPAIGMAHAAPDFEAAQLPPCFYGDQAEAPFAETCYEFGPPADSEHSDYDGYTMRWVDVRDAQGFHFEEWDKVGNSRHKPGLEADQPGDRVDLVFDTMHGAGPTFSQPVIKLMSLVSYTGMGKVEVECRSGCSCDSVTMDALDPSEKISVFRPLRVLPTASPECVLRATILPDTSDPAGGHKIKLIQAATFFVRASGATHTFAEHRIRPESFNSEWMLPE